MSIKLKLKQYQVTLLELYALGKNFDTVHVPSHVKWSIGGLGPVPYIERQRKRQRKDRDRLWRRIDYLKRQHYVERVKEGEERLLKLTSKAKFEILRLQFALHMRTQKLKSWNKKFYLVVFDVPEEKKKYRDFFRRLLRQNGFRFLQLSVWVSRCNPRPAIDKLLKYLEIERYFEIMEIPCQGCSKRLARWIAR